MNKIILIIWVGCIILLFLFFVNSSRRDKFLECLEKGFERSTKKKNDRNIVKKFPLYQLIIYYVYIFIVFVVLIFGPLFIQMILVALKEYFYVPEDSIVVYNSGIEILCYFAGFLMLMPIIALVDLIVDRGFLLEIDRHKIKFNAIDDGMLMNIVMPIFCLVIIVPLLFLGLNHYRYCTDEVIVIKTIFSKEKIYNYDDVNFVLRHEYNVDMNASQEDKEERFDYKVYFKDGNSYKISDKTIFEKEIIDKKNIVMINDK